MEAADEVLLSEDRKKFVESFMQESELDSIIEFGEIEYEDMSLYPELDDFNE